MPTLVEMEFPFSGSESAAGSTAQASDMMWMENEFRANPCSESYGAEAGSDTADESTLSGSMLIAALQDMTKKSAFATQGLDTVFPVAREESRHGLHSPSRADTLKSNGNDSTLSCSTLVVALDTLADSGTAPRCVLEFHDSTNARNTDGDLARPNQMNTNLNAHEQEVMRDSMCSRTLDESYFAAIDLEQRAEHSVNADCSHNENMDVLGLHPRKERCKGPMEQEYSSRYQNFVNNKIRSFQTRHPSKLPDYRNMCLLERQNEQHRVLKLLQRLKIAPAGNDEDNAGINLDTNSHGKSDAHYLANSDNRLHSQGCDEHEKSEVMEMSLALLSPSSGTNAAIETLSTSSIEIARSRIHFDSPVDEKVDGFRKRMASVSGKRGTDMSRARMDEFDGCDRYPDQGDLCFEMIDTSTSRRLSPEGINHFSASQSPILPGGSSFSAEAPSPDAASVHRDISFGEKENEIEQPRRAPNDTIEETVSQETKVRWNSNSHGSLCEAVYLIDGRTAHFRPLAVQRSIKGRSPTQSFPDPTGSYDERTRRRLSRLFKWIQRQDSSPSGRGLILSLEYKQVMDTVLKLLLDSSSRQSLPLPRDSKAQTLIVSRSKEELEEWGRVLLEGSSFSVLNHAALPLRDRKMHATASKCSCYDIVLTTYDAIKSPDCTITVDTNGVASFNTNAPENGWHSCRSQTETLVCKKLSVLHQLVWRRVLFVDVVDKKCYLSKSGTARNEAARALSSESRYAIPVACQRIASSQTHTFLSLGRFIFVVGSPQSGTSLSALKKSDKDALASIGSVLHSGKESILDIFVDFHDASCIR
jgi:hypothetical protein